MIDPIVVSILKINTITGIVSLVAAGCFQIFRKEKKSACALFSLAIALTAIIVIKNLFFPV